MANWFGRQAICYHEHTSRKPNVHASELQNPVRCPRTASLMGTSDEAECHRCALRVVEQAQKQHLICSSGSDKQSIHLFNSNLAGPRKA